MPRGSKPGERRGGRQRGTPNKSTLLKNAAIKAAATDPNLSPLDFLLTSCGNEIYPLSFASPSPSKRCRSLTPRQSLMGRLRAHMGALGLTSMGFPWPASLRRPAVRCHCRPDGVHHRQGRYRCDMPGIGGDRTAGAGSPIYRRQCVQSAYARLSQRASQASRANPSTGSDGNTYGRNGSIRIRRWRVR